MDYEDRKPKQLERIRKEHYNRVYSRQNQLMKRLRPLLNESDIIEVETEPFEYLKVKPKTNGKSREKLKKEINKFSNNRKKSKEKTYKKISQIRPDVLFGMS